MQQCAVHNKLHLTNEYSRVGYLIDAIKTNDYLLQATMDIVYNDAYPMTGKQSNFEETATCLLPHDPVANKHNNKPYCHRGTEISSIDSLKINSGWGQ